MTDKVTVSHAYDASSCVVRPGEGQKVDSGMVLKLRAQDMDGFFSLMEGCLQPKQLLAPHTHQRETQAVFVIEGGDLMFEVGGEDGITFPVEVGAYVIKPKGVEHAFWNPGDTPVRYIELSTGQNFEGFQLSTDQGNKFKVIREAGDTYKMVIHVERIPKMMREHGLTSVSGMKLPAALDAAKVLDFLKPVLG